ncbi:MAG: AbiV family abortive infection protein [Nitrosopumilus sp.]|nr:AbiV family abortive infection protein [Nitrosopumilus sp.]
MSNKTQYQLTQEQAKKAIKMCLDNAWSYLEDADMYIANNRTEHIAIPIAFAMEEIGKAKIIYDKIEKNNSKILLSNDKDGIYDHTTKIKKTISLIELDFDDDVGEAVMIEQLTFGGSFEFEYFIDQSKISDKIKQENELKDIGKQGHKIRLASSFVGFDATTSEPKIKKSTVDLTKLIKALYQIITGYPSSFNTY